MQYSDTLVCDTATVAYWQANPAYNYNRELLTPEVNVLGWIRQMLADLLRHLFGNRFAEDYTTWVFIILFILLIAIVFWVLYKKHPELFIRSRKHASTTNGEDTIYGVDFEKEITDALKRNDYKEAVRFLYLQTLKQLSDAELINWQLYKTPTEYIYEVTKKEFSKSFRELTNDFLRVRYGNFQATEELFLQMRNRQQEMKKGGLA